jgi:hypothetical protein
MIDSVKIDTSGVIKKLDGLEKGVKRALIKTTNQLSLQGYNQARKELKEEYNVPPEMVDQGLHRTPAQQGSSYQGKTRTERLYSVITARGKRIPLFKFGAVPQVPPAQKGRPISTRTRASVQILKKGPRRHVQPDATGNMPFVARMTSGFGGTKTNHVGIFVRTEKWRPDSRGDWLKKFVGARHRQHQVIRELKSEGIAMMFLKRGREKVRRLVMEKGRALFEKNLKAVGG